VNLKTELIPAQNRIIIGDVGSGKTAVAIMILFAYLENLRKNKILFNSKDYIQKLPQAVFLAPTEVLAVQHYHNLWQFYQKHQKTDLLKNYHLILITNKQKLIDNQKFSPKKFEKELEQILQNSKTKLVFVGTQALLFRENITPDLVLVDEQHRFGVRQRQELNRNKDLKHENKILGSHYISFTATPIPRTLALTVYKNLRPVFLQKLSNRKPIQTRLLKFENLETELLPNIQTELDLNHKIYIICPKIEENENGENQEQLWSVQKATEFFETHFPNQVLSLHGKDALKKEKLNQFRDDSSKSILVSTTVIEVGVDVKAASLIVILNAERFGLAALHQIRGRVGRNNFENNYCFLAVEPKYLRSRRLRFLCQINDGFAISQKDLELRGSGDMATTLQSGFDSDMEAVLGLDPQMYFELQTLTENLDYQNLSKNLPRLEKYLQTKSQKVWEE